MEKQRRNLQTADTPATYKELSADKSGFSIKVDFATPRLVSKHRSFPDLIYIEFKEGSYRTIKLKVPRQHVSRGSELLSQTAVQTAKVLAGGSIIGTLILTVFASQAVKFIWPLYNTLQLVLVLRHTTNFNPMRPSWDQSCTMYPC